MSQIAFVRVARWVSSAHKNMPKYSPCFSCVGRACSPLPLLRPAALCALSTCENTILLTYIAVCFSRGGGDRRPAMSELEASGLSKQVFKLLFKVMGVSEGYPRVYPSVSARMEGKHVRNWRVPEQPKVKCVWSHTSHEFLLFAVIMPEMCLWVL